MPGTGKDSSTTIILLSFMCAAAIVFTQLLKIPPKKIVVANTGIFFYFLYLKSNSFGFRFRSDYIQSGEGFLAMMLAALCWGFFPSSHRYGSILVLFAAMALFEYCLIRIINPRGHESLLYGTYMNALSLTILGLMVFRYRFLDQTEIYHFLSGMMQSRNLSYSEVAALFFTAVTLLLLLFRVNPELLLFSHGRRYFTLTGLSYGVVRAVMVALRGILLTLAILTLGFTAGIGNYYTPEGRGISGQIEVLLFSALYTQFILILMEAVNIPVVIAVSIAFTYVISILNQRNSGYIYDRNQ